MSALDAELAEGLVGVGEIAELLGTPTSWVYTAAEAGTIPSYKIGRYRRFRRSEIELWIRGQRGGTR